MSTQARRHHSDTWTSPPGQDEPPEPGHHAHVRAAIEEGRAQIAAGHGIPAEEAWKELGIE